MHIYVRRYSIYIYIVLSCSNVATLAFSNYQHIEVCLALQEVKLTHLYLTIAPGYMLYIFK